MKSLRIFDRRAGYLLTAVAMLVAVVSPGLLSATVSAATVSSRSVALSSSAADASGVTYKVKFTVGATGAAAGFNVDFCNDSPVAGATCTTPTGFSSAGVTTPTASTTVAVHGVTKGVTVTKTIANNATVEVELAGLHNPTAATTAEANKGFYARIITFDTAANAGASAVGMRGTGAVDDGGVAMAITSPIEVSATVMETMTFCVSGADTSLTGHEDCKLASATAPTVKLGATLGALSVLDSSAVYTGTVYTQLSTNASTGAVVNMKSNTTGCGGLNRAGAPGACNILPATSGGIAAGQAKFGVKTGTASNSADALAATGTYQPAGSYNSSTYFLNYVAGDATGVTSTYGDAVLNTNGAPVNNVNMPLTFGASVGPTTPAGNYSASISMIATGTY